MFIKERKPITVLSPQTVIEKVQQYSRSIAHADYWDSSKLKVLISLVQPRHYYPPPNAGRYRGWVRRYWSPIRVDLQWYTMNELREETSILNTLFPDLWITLLIIIRFHSFVLFSLWWMPKITAEPCKELSLVKRFFGPKWIYCNRALIIAFFPAGELNERVELEYRSWL